MIINNLTKSKGPSDMVKFSGSQNQNLPPVSLIAGTVSIHKNLTILLPYNLASL